MGKLSNVSHSFLFFLFPFFPLKMRRDILNDELDQLTHSYDYGIVPGSATVFVKDELNNLARMDLTLLENIIVVIEISEQGYKVKSNSFIHYEKD